MKVSRDKFGGMWEKEFYSRRYCLGKGTSYRDRLESLVVFCIRDEGEHPAFRLEILRVTGKRIRKAEAN